MPTATQRAVAAAVEFFRWDIWAALRAAQSHVPDEHGQCVACRTQTRHKPWPCVVAYCARLAIEAENAAHLALSATVSPEPDLPLPPIRATKEEQ